MAKAKRLDLDGVADGGVNAAYEAAMRHSRRVRFLRKAIPVFCAACVVAPAAWSVVAPFARTGPDITIGKATVSGSKVTMDAPKLSGFKKDNKAYNLTADSATQDLKAPSIVELNNLNGRMQQTNDSFARVTADWGRFDQGTNRLDLKGTVRVRTDEGYEIDLDSALVDMKSGDMKSLEPVIVRSASGSVSAETVEVLENGKHIIFEGRVRSTFIQTGPEDGQIRKTTTQ
ncbi:MAG: LPS export ABC transporter periplasmic protein LptC [Beijerinckiaceae bacterium]